MNLERLPLGALIAQWARIVDLLERPDIAAQDETHDFATDMNVRHEIARRSRTRPLTSETRDLLREMDEQCRAATHESTSCVHGDDRASAESWTPQREWYFWRAPKGH